MDIKVGVIKGTAFIWHSLLSDFLPPLPTFLSSLSLISFFLYIYFSFVISSFQDNEVWNALALFYSVEQVSKCTIIALVLQDSRNLGPL